MNPHRSLVRMIGATTLAMLLVACTDRASDQSPPAAPDAVDPTVSGVRILNDCPELPCGGVLEPGEYRWTFSEPRLDFEVSSPGWSWLFSGGGNLTLFADESPTHEGVYVSDGVYFLHDPTIASRDCEDSSEPGVGRSMGDLVAWLETAPGLVVSEPTPVAVGGLEGMQLDIEIDPTWERTCFWSGKLPAVPLLYNGKALGGYNWPILPDQSMRWYILESDDGVIVVDVDDGPDNLSHEELLRTGEEIVDSLTFSWQS
jgi:hypothetical protein